MEGWFLFVGALIFFCITVPSGIMVVFREINGEDCLVSKIVWLVSVIFVILALTCFILGYKDTSTGKEDCLNSGGIYSDIPGRRGCIYGGIEYGNR